MKYFLIAGEPSGDAIGEKLIRAIRAQDPEAELVGIGGARMKAAGLECLYDMNDLTVMGIWEVVMRLPHLKKLIDGVVAEIEKRDIDALVTIDFPDFNLMVAKKVRKRGKSKAKLIHYVAPTVWAWRAERAKKVSKFLDAMMCILPFEPEYFKAHKLRSVYVGNPIIEELPDNLDKTAFRREQDIPEHAKLVGLCFGSRISEIERIGPVIVETVQYLNERYPDLHVVCPTIPKLEFDILETIQDVKAPKFVLCDTQKKWNALSACDFTITVSGTMALELAYAGLPHVCLYKTSGLTYTIAKSLVKAKYIHLANIMLDEMVVPEFIQGACASEPVALEIIVRLENPAKNAEQLEKLKKIHTALDGEKGESPSMRAARYIRYVVVSDNKKAG